MSVIRLAEYERDPCKAVRRQLEALWKLDADRIALGRLQNAFGATTRPATTAPQSPSVVTSAPNPTDGGRRA